MKLNEEILESRLAFDGKLVRLRVDTVKLPNGHTATREIVEHRGAICAVPMLNADKIVMVRQFRLAAGEALLELPAGSLNVNEEPEKCAERELIEEIGYRPGKLTLMFRSYLAPGYSSEMLHTYLAQDLEFVGAQAEEDEFLEIVEVTLDEAVKLISTGGIRDAKTICGVLMAQKILQNS